MRRFVVIYLFAALVATIVLAGCGGRSPSASHPAGTLLIPSGKIKVGLESARTPEGAKGADVSHFVVGSPFLPSLIGSAIHIDAVGLRLIDSNENVYESRYCPYWDPYGHVWTRGFGETDWSGNFGGVCISHGQAEANVRYQVETKYQYAVRGLGMNLSQNQVNALDDFVWNLGAGIFTGSLRYQIQHREWSAILAYDIAGGVRLSGLATRRQAEYRLLVSYSPPPPKPLTHAQVVAKERRELAGHEHVLTGLRVRQRVLRRELAAKGCYRRLKTHRAGPTCLRWKREGNEVSSHGKREDTAIAKLRRELA